MNPSRLVQFNLSGRPHRKDFIGVLRVLGIVAISSVMAFGCARKECFRTDYDDFVERYGDDGDDRFDKFCEDAGYDRADGWSIGGMTTPGEICCEKDGFFSF